MSLTVSLLISLRSVRGILAGLFLALFLGAQACSSEAPKAAVLETITPSQGLENQPVAIVITGQHFRQSVRQVTLLGLKHEVELEGIQRMDATTIKARVPAQSPPGIYDVRVTFAESQSVVLGGAYRILPYALRITILDIGQGDATLIQSPTGQTMLIDAGTNANADEINRTLKARNITSLDHILATHYDQDHVEGFARVIKGPDGALGTADDHPPRKAIWDRGGFVKNQSYLEIRTALSKQFPHLHKPLKGDTPASFPTIDLGAGVTVQVRMVNGYLLGNDKAIHRVSCQNEENCYSIGTLITFGKFRFWTAGDLTGGGIRTPDAESLLAQHIGRVTVYRVHHHGSRTSSSEALIQALNPQIAVISAGEQNSFCHPHTSVLRNLSRLAKPAFLLTTLGVISSQEKCPNSPPTKDYIQSLGSKALLGLGTFTLVAQDNTFSLEGRNAPPNTSWTIQN